MASLVIVSVALSPTQGPVPAGDPGAGDQLAFDDEDDQDDYDSRIPPPTTEAPDTNVPDTEAPTTETAEPATDGGPATTAAPQSTTAPAQSAAPGVVTSAGDGPPRTADGWAYDWGYDPGVRGSINDWRSTNGIDAAAFGVIANDGKDDHAGIAAALASLGDGGGVVVLPAGKIHTSSTISLSSRQVLRGADGGTTILFTKNMTWGIEMGGGYPTETGKVTTGPAGAGSLTVSASTPPIVGQHAVVRGGPAPSQNAGQVVEITSVQGGGNSWTIGLADPTAQDLTGAIFSPFDAGQGIGLEQLNLAPVSGVEVNYHVVLRHTANSWVTNVRSDWATRSHIYTRQSSRCEVTENVMVEATNKGDGGHGYGLNIANNTTGCLFLQNQLSLLRHSMLLHGGATANVVAYNTSTEARHPNFVNGGPADMSFHGYAVANLVEGNIIQRVQLTDAGIAGADNTILRNCITTGPPTLKNGPVRAMIVGNSILGTNQRLQQKVMPAVEWSAARAYTTSALFDADGIIVQDQAPDLVLDSNWFSGTVSGTKTPPASAFAAGDLVPTTPTGALRTDCPYAP